MDKLPIVAIDGPSGVGKSSSAKLVAKALDWNYLDTGAMYRCIALALSNFNMEKLDKDYLEKLLTDIQIEQKGSKTFLNGEDVSIAIRQPGISKTASFISANSFIRELLVKQQRNIGIKGKWVVDGRDIGTVVFPEACCKIFLNASAEARAQRRFLELKANGCYQSYEEVLKEQQARDHADSTRTVAPLCKASDAIELDSSNMSLQEVVEWIVEHHKRHSKV